MPRVSRAEAGRNRAAIERAASRLIRERGLGVSVADLMGAAGLTHGGFYGHFESKGELAAIACAHAFADSVERWRRRTAGATDAAHAKAALVRGYLTSYNRSTPGSSCPMATLAADIAREDDGAPVRRVFRDGLEDLIGILAAVQPEAQDDAEGGRAAALAEISTLVGALVLARATKGNALSNEIMAAARRQLLGDESAENAEAAHA